MTFDFARHCMPAAPFAHSGAGPLSAGLPCALVVALVERGRCAPGPAAAPPEGPEEEVSASGGVLDDLLALDGGPEVADTGGLDGIDTSLDTPSTVDDATEGGVILGAGPLPLAPEPGCSLVGLCLTGAAPEQLAAQLAGVVVIPAGQAAGIAIGLSHLVEGEALPAAEQSVLAYALVCQLVQALQSARALPPLVAAAVAQIRAHYAEVYGVEELADGLMVSKSHLIRSFTAAMGVTPGKYLTAVRLENARRLLAQGGYSLEAVAGLCGFSGANYLCKVFKKETGETPAAWRRRAAPASGPQAEWEAQLYL